MTGWNYSIAPPTCRSPCEASTWPPATTCSSSNSRRFWLPANTSSCAPIKIPAPTISISKSPRDRLRIRTPSVNKLVGQLSGGNQQKVVLSKIEALDNYTDYLPDESDHTGDDIYIRDALRAAIASLSEEFRETIELRYFEELSYEEIAEVLGIGIPLAKIRVFRAKQQLQKILTPYIREIR